jgi:hypothetical protein
LSLGHWVIRSLGQCWILASTRGFLRQLIAGIHLYLNMKVFRWIGGFIFALLITFVLLAVFEGIARATSFFNGSRTWFLIYHTFGMVTCYFLFVFLACYFVPVQKKYAGILAVIITVSLLTLSIYFLIVNRQLTNLEFISDIVASMAGIQAGFYFSYRKFKNSGWGKVAQFEEEVADEEFY